jgi:hypothetical protein
MEFGNSFSFYFDELHVLHKSRKITGIMETGFTFVFKEDFLRRM